MEIIYYTGRGLPPFLSTYNLPSLQLCFPHFYGSRSLFKTISLPNYTSSSSTITYLSIRDIMNPNFNIAGHADYSVIKVPVPQNTEITLEEYMKFAYDARTTYIISFSEEAGLSAGGKKADRSAKNAVQALDDCLKHQRTSKILGSIQGGKDIEARVWCAKEMRKREVDGLIIGGMYANDFGILTRKIIKSISQELKGYEKMIVLSGPGRLLDVIYAAQYGITHSETMWPFKLAAEGKALSMDLSKFEIANNDIEDADYLEAEINLNDIQFRYQQGPLVEGCKCLTCRQHHRGYIYHLLQVNEMTANTLLAIHNTHVYQGVAAFIIHLKTEKKIQYAYSTFVRNFCLMNSE